MAPTRFTTRNDGVRGPGYTLRLTARQEGLEYRTATDVYRFDVALVGREWRVYLPGSKGEQFAPHELSAAEAAEILPRVVAFLEWDRLFGLRIRRYAVRTCGAPSP